MRIYRFSSEMIEFLSTNVTHLLPSDGKTITLPNNQPNMKAFILSDKEKVEFRNDIPQPVAQAGEALVQLHAAALNHRDVWISKGLYPGIAFPTILGSDGAGVCEGREVVINPSIGWGKNPAIQSKDYQILGMPKHGTLAEWTVVPQSQIYDKPAHLNMDEAAAIPLAGLTAYRAVFSKGGLNAGQKVLVTGIGGGVALWAVQLALAAGAEVFVTSGHDAKLNKAQALGARGGVNYKETDWAKTLRQQAGGFDLVIDGAGGEGLAQVLAICLPGAKVVVYGGGRGVVPQLSPQLLFWKQISILGTSMGNDAEFAALMEMVVRHQIRPVVDSVFPLEDTAAAFAKMAAGEQFGKIIIRPI